MTAKDLSNQITVTYRMLRLGLAVLAFAFPILLWGGGYILGHLPLAGSMSAYYHASDLSHPELGPPGQGVMRNVFVGILFVVGGLLIVYQGMSRFEDWALNLAGVTAFGVALFPMSWGPAAHDHVFSVHGAFAITFFACIAYVCIWRAGDSLVLIQDPKAKQKYQRLYQSLGVAMVLCPLAAWALISLLPFKKTVIFFVELAGIYVFALYWVIKSREASRTQLDEKAQSGKVTARPQGVSHVFRASPLTVH